jgi:hypothetical protein
VFVIIPLAIIFHMLGLKYFITGNQIIFFGFLITKKHKQKTDIKVFLVVVEDIVLFLEILLSDEKSVPF